MKNKELISVIVPIYNAEKFLDKSIPSILKQTYTNLEIILVDDGSTDSSLLICEDYKKKDSRITIIHQDNMGLSAARNTGLDNMSSDYCVFIDADDEILETMIEELYNLLIECDADISICSFFEIREDKESDFKQVEQEEIVELSGDDKYSFIFNNPIIATVQWNKLFKKYIFDDLRYPVGLYHEDEHVVHHEFYRAKKIVYTNRKLYLYYRHSQSITAMPLTKRTYDAELGFHDAIQFYKKIKSKKYYHEAIIRFLYYRKYESGIKNNQTADYEEYYPKIKKLERKYALYDLFFGIKLYLYNIKVKLLQRFNKNN